jgi:hypothetical protein
VKNGIRRAEAPGTCRYEHTFVVFMGRDLKRWCVLELGHVGNHVVIEPVSGRPLEVQPPN